MAEYPCPYYRADETIFRCGLPLLLFNRPTEKCRSDGDLGKCHHQLADHFTTHAEVEECFVSKGRLLDDLDELVTDVAEDYPLHAQGIYRTVEYLCDLYEMPQLIAKVADATLKPTEEAQ